MPPIDVSNEMSPMVKILADLNQSGYTTQFKACEKGVTSMDSQKCYKPREVDVKHFYRFEGDSSSDDSSVVYAIETRNGEKGTLIDSYGAYADPHVEEFIKKVRSIEK